MLDSLWRTVVANMDVDNVYYAMDGGMDLVLPQMSAWNVFPADLPYMGSPFFFAHEDVRGDLIPDEQEFDGPAIQEPAN